MSLFEKFKEKESIPQSQPSKDKIYSSYNIDGWYIQLPQEWKMTLDKENEQVIFDVDNEAGNIYISTFRKVKGYSFASTMCIGNLRSGMESLCAYWKTQNRTNLQKSFCYWGIILMFAIGAALGVFCVAAFGARAIWISCLLLSVSFLFMFAKEDMEELKEEIEEIEEKKLF